jgi:hypothetical protein
MMNLKCCGRKRSCPNLRYCTGICLEGLRETTKIVSQHSRCLGRDLNPGTHKYEAGVLTPQLQRLVSVSGVMRRYTRLIYLTPKLI